MNLCTKISNQVSTAVEAVFGPQSTDPQLTVPDSKFGDFSTNVALQLASKLGKNPRKIAELVASELSSMGYDSSVAGPGFINIRISSADLVLSLSEVVEQGDLYGSNTLYAGKTLVAEYSDMNAFKTAHAGHLYTTLVGDVVANLYAVAGATVHRTNFGGDVGLHVAKAMWSIMKYVDGDYQKLEQIEPTNRSAWVAARYVEGNAAYESGDEAIIAEIAAANKNAYNVHAQADHESDFARIYWECRAWSYEGFEQFYAKLGLVKPAGSDLYFHYYPESETAPYGRALVAEGLKNGVFEESEGAVIYRGEKDGLHTRVFLTKQALPTYESKDLGLAIRKWVDYHFDISVIITANEIQEYMKVVLAALNHFNPEIVMRTKHLVHGMIKLEGGAKMSSRKGTVVLPEEVLESARAANYELTGKDQPDTVLAAVKYAFLKQRIGGDIVYSPTESVSTIGNSGPYLQYAHARARSILAKSTAEQLTEISGIDASEHQLIAKIVAYPSVVESAVQELAPHLVCTYLYDLAQEFNRFYESSKVIGSSREAQRIMVVRAYAQALKNGLGLLGIVAPEKM